MFPQGMTVRLLSILSLAALTICVATCLLWVRSAGSRDRVEWRRHDTVTEQRNESVQQLDIQAHHGLVELWYTGISIKPPHGPFPMSPWQGTRRSEPARGAGPRWMRWKFRWHLGRHDRSLYLGRRIGAVQVRDRALYAAAPLWTVTLAMALPAALWWGVPLLRRRSRRRSGKCIRCGYDLRESKDNCPECGTPVPAPAEARRQRTITNV